VTAYGFDLDGTLDQPGIAQLANDLFDAGHEVYVVTGGLDETGEWTLAERELRLARLGVRYTAVVRCIHPDITEIGRLKGEQCERLDIRLLVDDSPLYLQGAQAATDAAMLMAVRWA
jgi:hypothetical protein